MARVYGISSTGVEYNPNAPCNEPSDIEVEVTISVTYHAYKTVKVPPNYTDLDLRKAVKEQIVLPGDMCEDTWSEDDMEVIEN